MAVLATIQGRCEQCISGCLTGRRDAILPVLEGLALTLSLLSLVHLLGLRISLAFEDIQTWT